MSGLVSHSRSSAPLRTYDVSVLIPLNHQSNWFQWVQSCIFTTRSDVVGSFTRSERIRVGPTPSHTDAEIYSKLTYFKVYVQRLAVSDLNTSLQGNHNISLRVQRHLLTPRPQEYTTAGFSTNVLVDSSTTLILTYYLRRNQTLTHKRYGLWLVPGPQDTTQGTDATPLFAFNRSTKNTIRKLIGYVVGSGALTMWVWKNIQVHDTSTHGTAITRMTSITILVLVLTNPSSQNILLIGDNFYLQFNVSKNTLYYGGLLLTVARSELV